ncbi:uncharacterized protein EI97DRAFT_455616 [Westerdykella ornata]|uniref:RING-type domain-containing protein n=1 Tax=Westerdykella ornata TaxID=318751 RepID=A0A6A6JU47_WESOR|nr:uncharacterized protein EI97DRAFT_455616 [Westerdykella ornata]KAF2279358.1 hypothetical protein EI97DRAFT_455616 [Westerdykella ornata]
MAFQTNSRTVRLPPPAEDFIYDNFQYRPDAQGARPCRLCQQVTHRGSEYTPNFCARVCGHWFHQSCLIEYLWIDYLPICFRDCYICRLNHYTARWKGPVLCPLKSTFPKSELPDIREVLTRRDIKARVGRVLKRDMWKPWFPELMEFCTEPQEVDGGLGVFPTVDLEGQEIAATQFLERRTKVREYMRGQKMSIAKR